MIKKFFPVFFILLLFLNSCGIYKRSDVKDNPVNVEDRVRKNIEQGKGIRFGNLGSASGGGVFDFASSNEMWRASIEILDFVPLTNASYSGGIIITDWFSNAKANDNKEIKITVRFLSNEIRAEGINVLIHERKCEENKINCKIIRKKTKLEGEIKLAILKKAAWMQKNDTKKISERVKKNRPKNIGKQKRKPKKKK